MKAVVYEKYGSPDVLELREVKKPIPKDLAILKELVEAGKVVPVIDRRYPLREAAEALRYLGKGHAPGKVVIIVEGVVT